MCKGHEQQSATWSWLIVQQTNNFVDTVAFYHSRFYACVKLSIVIFIPFCRKIETDEKSIPNGSAATSACKINCNTFLATHHLDSPGTVQNSFACAQLPNLLEFFFHSELYIFSCSSQFFFLPLHFAPSTNSSYNTNIGSRLVGSTFFSLAIERQRIQYFYQMV